MPPSSSRPASSPPASARPTSEGLNVTSKPVDTIVAFPLPNLDEQEWYNSELGTTTNDPVNFVGFRTLVDGRAIRMRVEQRALGADGRDATALLNRCHVPLNPAVVFRALDRQDPLRLLSSAGARALLAAHLITDTTDRMPTWTTRTNFWWRQRFDPGRTVEIDQSYQPITGEYYDVKVGTEQNVQNSLDSDLDADTCPNARTRQALRAKYASKPVCQSGDCLASYVRFYTTIKILVVE